MAKPRQLSKTRFNKRSRTEEGNRDDIFTGRTYETALFWLSWPLLILSLASFFCRIGSGIDPNRLFNADSLYAAAFYKDLVVDGFSWSGWCFPPAPYFFPDIALFPIVYWITGDYIAATAGFGVIQIILSAVGFVYLARELCKDVSLSETVPLVLLAVFIVLRTTGDELFFFVGPLYTPVTHTGGFIVSLFSLILIFRYIRNDQSHWRLLAVAGGLAVLTSASDQLFLLEFVIPCLVSLLLFSRSGLISRKKSLLAAAVLSFSSLLGLVSFRLMVVNPLVQHYYTPSREKIWNAFQDFSADMHFVFGNFPIPAFLWCLSIGLCLIVILTCRRRRECDDKRYLPYSHPHDSLTIAGVFSVLTAGSVIAGTLLLGNYTNIWSIRYFPAAWLFPMGVAGTACIWFMHERRTLRFCFNTVLFLTALGWFFSSGLPFLSTKRLVPTYYPPLVECLDKHKERFNLRYGLCNYWFAKTITLLSKKDLRVYQITPNGNPHLWINNACWYLGEKGSRYEHPTYNFVVVDDSSKERLSHRLGVPRDTFRCGNSEVRIYDTATMQQLVDSWIDRLPESVVASSPNYAASRKSGEKSRP